MKNLFKITKEEEITYHSIISNYTNDSEILEYFTKNSTWIIPISKLYKKIRIFTIPLFIMLLFYKLAFPLSISMLFVATPLIFNALYLTIFIIFTILIYVIQKTNK